MEIGRDAGMEIRKEAGEAFFQEMQARSALLPKPLRQDYVQEIAAANTTHGRSCEALFWIEGLCRRETFELQSSPRKPVRG